MEEKRTCIGNGEDGISECPVRWEELGELMEKAKLYVIVLGGPQLGGKNGFAKKTREYLGEKNTEVYHLSTGDELRMMKDKNTDKTMKEGGLVGSDTVMNLIQNRIKKICHDLLADGNEPSQNSLLLLDGAPRTNDQAKTIHQMLGDKLRAVIVLDVSKVELHRRRDSVRMCCSNAECGEVFSKFGKYSPKQVGVCDRCGSPLFVRDDETPESLDRRWGIYFSETEPALDSLHYMGHMLFHICNNEGEAAYLIQDCISELLQ